MEALSPIHWRTLRYFHFYRLLISVFILLAWEFPALGMPVAGSVPMPYIWLGRAYTLLCLASYLGVSGSEQRNSRVFHLHLAVAVAVDILVFASMQHFSGWRAELAVFALVSVAAAGLVSEGRWVLFFAALATLVFLTERVWLALSVSVEAAQFVSAGALCLGFFATAVSARLLARRAGQSEALAHSRGEDLRRQRAVTDLVFSTLNDGVALVSRAGDLLQANPRALRMLGAAAPVGHLALLAPELAAPFQRWRDADGAAAVDVWLAAGGEEVVARFMPVEALDNDVLIFLEDVGEHRAQAQQQKLAALGRLTANIAHEIRNPLSAVRHAGELLREAGLSRQDARLLDIMLDNSARIESIVRDVLQLGRRDRVQRESIDLAGFVESFLEEFALTQRIEPARLALQVGMPAGQRVEFDPTHLRQILWNLLSNAVRYASPAAGAVGISLALSVEGRGCMLAVCDDGVGVSPEMQGRLFEPFATSESKGTGLGLYIARELATANGARLLYRPRVDAAGACFELMLPI